MDLFWSRGPNDARTAHMALGRSRGITLNTIQSTLKRLFEKGLLERAKVSHAHVYQACVTREQFHCTLLKELVGGIMDGQGEVVVSAFVDIAERAGPEHLERLEALVAHRRRALQAARKPR